MVAAEISVPLAKSILIVGAEVIDSLNTAVILSVSASFTTRSLPLLVRELTVGGVVSIIKSLLAIEKFKSPGLAKVKVPKFSAASKIVPPFSTNEFIEI